MNKIYVFWHYNVNSHAETESEENPVQDKIIELETKFSFQEDLLADLNDEIVRQQRQLSELVREVAMIKMQMAEVIERDVKQVQAGDEHEMPPHY